VTSSCGSGFFLCAVPTTTTSLCALVPSGTLILFDQFLQCCSFLSFSFSQYRLGPVLLHYRLPLYAPLFFCFGGGRPLHNVQHFIFHIPTVDLAVYLAISSLVVLLKVVSRFPVLSSRSLFRSCFLRYRSRPPPKSFTLFCLHGASTPSGSDHNIKSQPFLAQQSSGTSEWQSAPYFLNPVWCFQFHCFGHAQQQCASSLVYDSCGKNGHSEALCPSPPCCVNCASVHAPGVGKYPIHQD
jgi:hypothetical protein